MNTKYVWGAVVVIGLGLIGWYFFRDDNTVAVNNPVESNQNLEEDDLAVEEEGASQTGAVVASGTASQSARYSQLVQEYEGRRIQFDALCQAIVPNTTYKNNTKIMFDNRSGDARVITIGGVAYNFPGYGYKIITVSGPSNQLPARIGFNCGTAVNVGTILIQN